MTYVVKKGSFKCLTYSCFLVGYVVPNERDVS